jgi:hypothetical protein
MKNMRRSFNRLAQKGGMAFMRHRKMITATGYFGGNGVMFMKDNLKIDLETLSVGLADNFALTHDTKAGFLFLFSAGSLYLAGKFPIATYLFAGATCIAGAYYLGVDAVQTSNDWKLLGSIAQGAVGVFVMANEPFNYWAKMPIPKDGWPRTVRNVFQPMFNLPLRTSAIMDCVSGGQLLKGAIVQKDPGMMLAMILWGVGASGLAMSDESTQRKYWAKKLHRAHVNSKEKMLLAQLSAA